MTYADPQHIVLIKVTEAKSNLYWYMAVNGVAMVFTNESRSEFPIFYQVVSVFSAN